MPRRTCRSTGCPLDQAREQAGHVLQSHIARATGTAGGVPLQISAVIGNYVKDQGQMYVRTALVLEGRQHHGESTVEARQNVLPLRAQRPCQTPLQSQCNRLEEHGECEETPVYEHRSGDRRYLQYVQQQSLVRVCCKIEMEEAGCYHALTFILNQVLALQKSGLRFNHPRPRKSVNRCRHEAQGRTRRYEPGTPSTRTNNCDDQVGRRDEPVPDRVSHTAEETRQQGGLRGRALVHRNERSESDGVGGAKQR